MDFADVKERERRIPSAVWTDFVWDLREQEIRCLGRCAGRNLVSMSIPYWLVARRLLSSHILKELRDLIRNSCGIWAIPSKGRPEYQTPTASMAYRFHNWLLHAYDIELHKDENMYETKVELNRTAGIAGMNKWPSISIEGITGPKPVSCHMVICNKDP